MEYRTLAFGANYSKGREEYLRQLREVLNSLHPKNWRKRQRIEGQIRRLEEKTEPVAQKG